MNTSSLKLFFSLPVLALFAGATFASAQETSSNSPSPAISDLLSLCASCHGTYGVSVDGTFPNLAGQKKDYIVKQLMDFREARRTDPTMGPMAEPLDDAAIDGLATFFSTLPAGQ